MIYFVTLIETDGDAVAIEVGGQRHLESLLEMDPRGIIIDGQRVIAAAARRKLKDDT